MSTSVRPSPALVVPADLPIGDAVRKMRDHDVGSLLVVREVLPHDLVGIFTERDLVHRIDEIQHGGYWDKGVASIMTKPVISVSVFEMRNAPEIMSRCHIRHLPVVYIDEEKQNHIVGVISMRDLFRNYYETGAKTTLEKTRDFHPKIGLACRNPLSIDMLRTILSQGGQAEIAELDPHELVVDPNRFFSREKPDALVVDLDFVPAAQWAHFLQQLNHEAKAPACVLLFTPALHEPKNITVLHKLSEGGMESAKISAFAKPMDILSFLEKIESFF